MSEITKKDTNIHSPCETMTLVGKNVGCEPLFRACLETAHVVAQVALSFMKNKKIKYIGTESANFTLVDFTSKSYPEKSKKQKK